MEQHGPSAIECKVVLLGKENVGKTCIMERFVHERFTNSTESQSTVGVVFGAKNILVNGRLIRLSLWDTAGSERFTSISRLYYRNAKAAIVCYDMSEAASLDRCLFWIEELCKTEENCKIYLVGTKLDLIVDNPRNRKVKPGDVEKLAKEIGAKHYETSSRTGQGITELFTACATDYVASLPPAAFIPSHEPVGTNNNASFQISDPGSPSAHTDPAFQQTGRRSRKTSKCCGN